MSTLVILMPRRDRASPPDGRTPQNFADAQPTEWPYALSRDGLGIDEEGLAAAGRLPAAERVVLVLHDDDVAWLPVRLPKVPASRMRDALAGALEDQILEETGAVHLAVAKSRAAGGGPQWAAAINKPWLTRRIEELRKAGVHVDAAVTSCEPGPSMAAHASLGDDGALVIAVSGPQGVVTWGAGAGGWKSRLAQGAAWSVEPAAAQALAALGLGPARLLRGSERALAAAAQGTDLLQFELAPELKASRAVRSLFALTADRRLRAAKAGLAVLVLVHLAGVNFHAWQAGQEVQRMRERAEQMLRASFPSVTTVIDPLAQMEREVRMLRLSAGQPEPADFDAWIDVIASVRAEQPEPLKSVRLDAQGMSFEASAWPAELMAPIQEHARRVGWRAVLEGSVLRVAPLTAPGQ